MLVIPPAKLKTLLSTLNFLISKLLSLSTKDFFKESNLSFNTFVVKYERDTHTAILVTGWNGNRGRQVIDKNRYLVTEK